MPLSWCDDATAYVKDLTTENNTSVDYVLFELTNPKSPSPCMELFSMGKGGRAKVTELLLPEPSRVITGAFLASAIDERGSVVSVRRKYIHVIWVGPSVSIMVKGKVNTSLTQFFKDQFPGCAMYLQLSDGDVDDLQPNVLERTLLASGGAHKPTRYSFSNLTLIGSLSLDESSFNTSERRRLAESEEMEQRRKRAAEAEARRKAADEARKQLEAEQEARRKAAEAEEARKKAAEEETRQKAEEERMQRIKAQEEERKRLVEQERLKFEQEQAAKARAAAELAAMTPKAALSDKKLIMLISSMSGNMTTSTNQAQAQSMLASLDVVPEIIDGADPAQKDVRNELFALSGLRGKYPQFFLKQVDGTMKFFGDFDTLAHYNDTGTLAVQIGGCVSPKHTQSENNSGAAPRVVSTLNGSKLLLLISSMSGSLEVTSNQNRMENIVKGLHLPAEEFVTIDGCEPSVRERRNELFGISGIRAKYPQLFLVKADGTTLFVGNFDDVSYLHDTNTLAQAIGLNSKTAAPEPTSTLNGNKLLLLISSMSGSLEVASNQTRVENIIKGLNLPHDEVEVMDGCDQSLKDRRNELFGISGIRAKYPQVFLVNGADGTTTFVGNFDDVAYLHDNNTLAQTVGLVSKKSVSAGAKSGPVAKTKAATAAAAAAADATTKVEQKPAGPIATKSSEYGALPVAVENAPEPAVDAKPEPPKESPPPQPTTDEALEKPVGEEAQQPEETAPFPEEAVPAPEVTTPVLDELEPEPTAEDTSSQKDSQVAVQAVKPKEDSGEEIVEDKVPDAVPTSDENEDAHADVPPTTPINSEEPATTPITPEANDESAEASGAEQSGQADATTPSEDDRAPQTADEGGDISPETTTKTEDSGLVAEAPAEPAEAVVQEEAEVIPTDASGVAKTSRQEVPGEDNVEPMGVVAAEETAAVEGDKGDVQVEESGADSEVQTQDELPTNTEQP